MLRHVAGASFWRRSTAVIVVLFAVIAITGAARPNDAHAYYRIQPLPADYEDWAIVRGDVICTASYPSRCTGGTITAYRWNSATRTWSTMLLTGGERVYAYPFADRWHWAWTQRTGWVAVSSMSLTPVNTVDPREYLL